MILHETFYKNFIDNNPYPRELINYDNKSLINFSSSDYLGLATHPLLIKRAKEYAECYGVGSSSSRLVTGNLSLYNELETQLAKAIGKPAALILGTGFQTNVSVLEALLDAKILGEEPLVFCDRLCHISLLASTRFLTRIQRFQHNDLDHLQDLLKKYANSKQPKFILAESVYSMDGDQADLTNLIKLAKQHHAFLYVDDAHAVGVFGNTGWGKASDFAEEIDIVMGTFSKGLGSFGGYIGCSKVIRDYLINKCKGLIYSTGLSPTVLGAIAAVLELVPKMKAERDRLLLNAKDLLNFFHQNKMNCGKANTHILPWIIGDADKTLELSRLLEEQGILGATIRPPSVPKGKSRIRFCLSAKHSEHDLEKLKNAIKKVL